MQGQFRMSDLGLLSFCLGIEVLQREDSICISQEGYARKVLDKVGMGGCNPCHTPMEPRLKLSKNTPMEPKSCPKLGPLPWVVRTSINSDGKLEVVMFELHSTELR
ncbi:unnamed protein product [Urochloa humidicola]